jgi:hypothetical protein
MSTTATPAPNHPAPDPPLPELPCPNCGENLLTEGFYNSCTETQSLREDNHAFVVGDHLYIDHDEDNYETIHHECDLEAFCRSCNSLLPWALYEIRALDGVTLTEAPAAIAELLSQLADDTTPPIATA